MSAIMKYDILDTIQECISILSRKMDENDHYLQTTLVDMETAYKLLEASNIQFKPIFTNEITYH